jgi:hypothetical protein
MKKRGVVHPEENLTQSEVILNGLRKDARGTTSSRQLRPRPARCVQQYVHSTGCDIMDGQLSFNGACHHIYAFIMIEISNHLFYSLLL